MDKQQILLVVAVDEAAGLVTLCGQVLTRASETLWELDWQSLSCEPDVNSWQQKSSSRECSWWRGGNLPATEGAFHTECAKYLPGTELSICPLLALCFSLQKLGIKQQPGEGPGAQMCCYECLGHRGSCSQPWDGDWGFARAGGRVY